MLPIQVTVTKSLPLAAGPLPVASDGAGFGGSGRARGALNSVFPRNLNNQARKMCCLAVRWGPSIGTNQPVYARHRKQN